MSKAHEPIEGEVVRTTAAAVLVRDSAGTETWVPRSLCEDGYELATGDDDVRVERWFALKEGLCG